MDAVRFNWLMIEKLGIPLDDYPMRCIEQIERWQVDAATYCSAETIEVNQSKDYASSIINSAWTGETSVKYGNQRNNGCITSRPADCTAEVPCVIGDLLPQLKVVIRINITVQEMTVRALQLERKPRPHFPRGRQAGSRPDQALVW